MTVAALAWLAMALLLWPPRRAGTSGAAQDAMAERARGRGGGARIPRGALQAIAATAIAAAAVAVLGPVAGIAVAGVGAPAAAWVVARLDARGSAPAADLRLARALDLVSAALRAGRPVDQALHLAAPSLVGVPAQRIGQVAGLLRLGADPTEAWRLLEDDPALVPLARAATRSAASGARLATALEELANDLRDQLRAAAQSRAHRAGVLAMAPLGLCFLPAFICLGVVPVIVGIVGRALVSLP